MSGHRSRSACDASCRARRVRRCTASCRAPKDLLFNGASGGQPMFKKTLVPSASPRWPPPHRPLFRPPTRGTSRFSSRSVTPAPASAAAILAPRRRAATPALPSSKVGAPQGEQPYQTGNAGGLAPAFFFGKNLPRGRQAALFRDCRRRLWQSFQRSNGRSLSLVFKRFLLRS